jgi:hypothetical protein
MGKCCHGDDPKFTRVPTESSHSLKVHLRGRRCTTQSDANRSPTSNSLLTGKRTGNFTKSGPPPPVLAPIHQRKFQSLADEFPAQRNREFSTYCRESFSTNREIIASLHASFKMKEAVTPGGRAPASTRRPNKKRPRPKSGPLRWCRLRGAEHVILRRMQGSVRIGRASIQHLYDSGLGSQNLYKMSLRNCLLVPLYLWYRDQSTRKRGKFNLRWRR